MKKLILSLILLFSLNARADLTGGWWLGEGMVWDKEGWRHYCGTIELQMSSDKDSVTFGPLLYRCGYNDDYVLPEIRMERKGDDLWFEDLKVGTISGDKLEWSLYQPDEGFRQYFQVEKTKDGVNFSEQWRAIEGTTPFHEVSGALKARY